MYNGYKFKYSRLINSIKFSLGIIIIGRNTLIMFLIKSPAVSFWFPSVS